MTERKRTCVEVVRVLSVLLVLAGGCDTGTDATGAPAGKSAPGISEVETNDQVGEGRGSFAMVYPVTYGMPDGSTIIATGDDEEGYTELKTWYDNNPGSEEEPRLYDRENDRKRIPGRPAGMQRGLPY